MLKESGISYWAAQNGYLEFFNNLNFEYILYKKEFNDPEFFNFIFEVIGRKMKVLFFRIFGSEVVRETLFDKDGLCKKAILANLEGYVSSNKLERTGFCNKKRFMQVLAVIKTAKKLKQIYIGVMKSCPGCHVKEDNIVSTPPGSCSSSDQEASCTKNNGDAESLCTECFHPKHNILNLYDYITRAYKEALKIEVTTEIMYFFDLFCRNLKSFQENTLKISNAINMLQKCNSSNQYFQYVFKTINFYIKHNLAHLDVSKRSDLERFLQNLDLLDEILCEIKEGPEDNLCESVDFLKRILEGRLLRKEEKSFYAKIKEEK